MSAVPYSENELAESAAKFAESITPAKARWAYCADRASYIYKSRKYGDGVCLNLRTVPVCAKVLGVSPSSARYRLNVIRRKGLDEAWAWGEERDAVRYTHGPSILGPMFQVGPMQAWHVGHIYFARVESHPHVLKIGFSRRVRERLDDIESKNKIKLAMRPREIRVGTLADEHWWHKNWENHRISGEWFFDHQMTERSLPDFLRSEEQARAA